MPSSQQPGHKQTGDSQNAAKLKGNEGAASGKVKEDPVALMEKDLDELHKAIDGKQPLAHTSFQLNSLHVNFHIGVSYKVSCATHKTHAI